MKSLVLSVLCALNVIIVSAQQGSIKGSVNTENFPEVSFIWHEYNPEIIDSTLFGIKENGVNVEFKCKPVTPDSIPQKKKSILFLWEDHPIGEDQFAFSQNLLYLFLGELTKDTTSGFNVAIFSKQLQNSDILKIQSTEFTKDKNLLRDSISGYESSIKALRGQSGSDLFLAIKEGLNLLMREPTENTRALFVITAGINRHTSGIDITSLISQSIQNKIPIYVIHFPTKGEIIPLNYLTKETNGQLISFDDDVNITKDELLKSFGEINKRHYGQDYLITFTSLLNRDKKTYPLLLKVERYEYAIDYDTPGFSLIVWAKQHIILFILFLLVLISVIVLGTIFGIRFYKKISSARKRKKENQERQKEQQKTEEKNIKNRLKVTEEEIKKQQRNSEQEKKQIEEAETKEHLTRLMQIKNLYPRFVVVGNEGGAFNISSATTTIGRESDNDIVLSDSTVSSYHAKIVFNGTCFEIYDLGSTNGIAINGNFIEISELKNSDIIILGDTTAKFYL